MLIVVDKPKDQYFVKNITCYEACCWVKEDVADAFIHAFYLNPGLEVLGPKFKRDMDDHLLDLWFWRNKMTREYRYE